MSQVAEIKELSKKDQNALDGRLNPVRNNLLRKGVWVGILKDELGSPAAAAVIAKTKDPDSYQEVRSALLEAVGSHERVSQFIAENPELTKLSKKELSQYVRTLRKNADLVHTTLEQEPQLIKNIAHPDKLRSFITGRIKDADFEKKLTRHLEIMTKDGWHSEALLLIVARGFREKGTTFYVGSHRISTAGLYKSRLERAVKNFGAVKNPILVPTIDRLKSCGVVPKSKGALSLHPQHESGDSPETRRVKDFVSWIINEDIATRLMSHPICAGQYQIRSLDEIAQDTAESTEEPEQVEVPLEEDPAPHESEAPEQIEEMTPPSPAPEPFPERTFKKLLDPAFADLKVLRLLSRNGYMNQFRDSQVRNLRKFCEEVVAHGPGEGELWRPDFHLTPEQSQQVADLLTEVSLFIEYPELDAIVDESVATFHMSVALHPSMLEHVVGHIRSNEERRLFYTAALVHNIHRLSKQNIGADKAREIGVVLDDYLGARLTDPNVSKKYPEFSYQEVWEDLTTELFEQVRGNSGLFFDAFAHLAGDGRYFSGIVAEAALEE